MNKTEISDIASEVWRPMWTNDYRRSSLTSASGRTFENAGDADGWGPLMLLHPHTVERLRDVFGERKSDVPTDGSALFQVRCHIYYGSYRVAEGLLPSLDPGDREYCGALIEYAYGEFGRWSQALKQNWMSIQSPRLRFMALIALCRGHLQVLNNSDVARDFLNQAKVQFKPSDPLDRCLKTLWLRRYELELDSILDDDLATWWTHSAGAWECEPWAREAMRRICDHQTQLALKSKRLIQADRSSALALRLDPNCSRACFLRAKVLSACGDVEQAGRLRAQSLALGFDERGSAPLRTKALRPTQQSTAARLKSKLEKSPRYELLRTFWEYASAPRSDSPLLAYTPYLSRLSAERELNPFLQTLTCQRVTPISFRREMIYGLLEGMDYKQRYVSQAQSFEFWSQFSESNAAFAARVSQASATPVLERSGLARQLCSLGFSELGRDLIRMDFSSPVAFSLEQSYAFSTWFFLSEISRPSSNAEFVAKLEPAYAKIPDAPETLRVRLCLAITACVYYGNFRQYDECLKWRQRGLKLLTCLVKSTLFSEFEKELLTSRFFRAASYVPFLSRDWIVLADDAEHIESYARGLRPHDARERILARENLYPMLETCSRIWSALGDKERASGLMHEIARDVDPMDAKAWLQAGEIHSALGDLMQARSAYQRAGDLGVPFGRIAWYKAGRTCEKLGDLPAAFECYVHSLELWPRGPSPLKRINILAEKMFLPHVSFWAREMLERVST